MDGIGLVNINMYAAPFPYIFVHSRSINLGILLLGLNSFTYHRSQVYNVSFTTISKERSVPTMKLLNLQGSMQLKTNNKLCEVIKTYKIRLLVRDHPEKNLKTCNTSTNFYNNI